MKSYLILAAVAMALLSTTKWGWAADNTSDRPRTLTESEMIFQSSQLSALNVFNPNDPNKKLGSLDDLIVNEHTGQVLYGILDTGFGGKKIAVPWNALQLSKITRDNKDTYWLTLNKTQEDLAGAPTFDKGHMPDFTSPQWKQSVDTFFGVRTVAKPEAPKISGELTTNQTIFQSSKLSDLKVYNQSDNTKKLGSLDNLIINAHAGQVLYGILSTGMVGKNIAVPWNAFQLQKAPDKEQYWLTLNKTQDELASAPTFDKNRMTDLTDSQWQQTVDRFFGVRTAAQPERQR